MFSLKMQSPVSRDCTGALIEGKWDLSCHGYSKKPGDITALYTKDIHIQEV